MKDPFLAPFLAYALVPPSHPVLAIDGGTGRVFVRAGAAPVLAAATPTLSAAVRATVVGAPPPFAAANGLNATAPLLPAVRAALVEALDGAWANPSSPHGPGRLAALRFLLDEAHERLETAI
jgi:hypothetical protein